MAQGTESLHHTGGQEEAPVIQLQISLAMATVVIWAVNCQMEALSLLVSSLYIKICFSNKKHSLKNLIYKINILYIFKLEVRYNGKDIPTTKSKR